MSAQASEARAPGKIILLGEHAVVYGQPAIALPLDRFVTVRCVPAERFSLATRPEVGSAPLELALAEVAKALGNPSVEVHIESALPVSAGLGSSAAVAVASARALAASANRTLDEAELLALAEGMERTFHGRPSGIDHTTCLRAVPLRFQRGEPHRVERLRVPRFEFVVSSAGPRVASTREKVLGLRQEWEQSPKRLEALFGEIGALVDVGAGALASSDFAELGRAMNRNQELLREVGVSTEAVDNLLVRMSKLGARGAKLTGAGGGGAVIAIHDEPERLVRELEGAGFTSFVARWEDA